MKRRLGKGSTWNPEFRFDARTTSAFGLRFARFSPGGDEWFVILGEG